MGVKIETKFSNGSISFKMIDDRLVKLTKSTIDDLMDLIQPGQIVRGDMVSVFANYWFNSVELVSGPNSEQREQWNSEPRWKHEPYIDLWEFILILGVLHEKDLGLLADFTKGTMFQNSLAYRNWHQWNERGGGYVNPERHSQESTTFVSPETWEAMKAEP